MHTYPRGAFGGEFAQEAAVKQQVGNPRPGTASGTLALANWGSWSQLPYVFYDIVYGMTRTAIVMD